MRKFLLNILLLMLAVARAQDFGYSQFRCPSGHRLTRFSSAFTNSFGTNQRFYQFSCDEVQGGSPGENCVNTPPSDSSREDLFLKCSGNSYIAGVLRHANGAAHRWQLICCTKSNVRIDESRCAPTHLVNEVGQDVMFRVIHGYVVRTMQSIYEDAAGDRRWWFEICPYNITQTASPDQSLQNILQNIDQGSTRPAFPQRRPVPTPVTSTATSEATSTTLGRRSNFQYDYREAQFQKMLSALKHKRNNGPQIMFAHDSGPSKIQTDLDMSSLKSMFPSLTETDIHMPPTTRGPQRSASLRLPPRGAQGGPHSGGPSRPQGGSNGGPAPRGRRLPPRPKVGGPINDDADLAEESTPDFGSGGSSQANNGFSVVDLFSNMQDGLKFAFKDKEGKFSLKDGIANTVEYLGLCRR